MIYNNYNNIKIIHLPTNMRKLLNIPAAQGATRMEGIKIATGDYIAFLDDDDIYIDKDKILKQVLCMELYNYVGIVSTNMSIENNKKYLNKTFGRDIGNKLYIYERKDIETKNTVNTSTVLVKRSIFEKSGSMKAEKYEDWECWKRMLNYSKGIYIDDETVLYDMGTNKNYIY